MKRDKNIRRVSTAAMERGEWLRIRRSSIGGSDAAAIVGLSRWSSPLSVWADKLGKLPDKPVTEAMRMGSDLEQYVAKRWNEAAGKKVERVNAILYNDQYPFAHANIDRWVVGENAGLECKTTSTLDLRQFQGIEFPEQYYAQCVHYMAVTGAERWYLCVMVYGRGMFAYALERDQAEIDALMDAERQFWRYVEAGTQPPADGSQATADTLLTLYPDAVNEQMDLLGREGMLHEWLELKAQKKALERRMDEIANIIKADLGETSRGVCPGIQVTWMPQIRKTFQASKFAKEHPELDLSAYYKSTQTRVFTIKPDKTDQ